MRPSGRHSARPGDTAERTLQISPSSTSEHVSGSACGVFRPSSCLIALLAMASYAGLVALLVYVVFELACAVWGSVAR